MEWYKVEWHIEANSQEEANKKRDEALAALSRHQAGTANDLLLAGAIGAGIALFAKAVTAPKPKNAESTPPEGPGEAARQPYRETKFKFEEWKAQRERDKNRVGNTAAQTAQAGTNKRIIALPLK
jgi:hypothetical protein